MSNKQGLAIGGSSLGGVIGGVIGTIIGGVIGSAGHDNSPTNTPLDLIDGGLRIFGLLVGVGIGGLVGAIVGAAIGAGFATRSRATENSIKPDAPSPTQLHQESTEAELARLQERMAELEERIRREKQP